MSSVAHVIAYLSLIIFLVAVVAKIVAYLKRPIHVRWELYPVAHETPDRAAYGGSFMEDVDWWKKERKSNTLGELKFMLPEILLLRGVFESNKKLWLVSFPFHFGLYLLMGFAGLLMFGVIMTAAKVSVSAGATGFGALVHTATSVVGPVGMILAFVGAAGLLLRRLMDRDLKNYSSLGHTFNLGLFLLTLGVAFITWQVVDNDFSMLQLFVYSLFTGKFMTFGSTLFAVQVILIFGLLAYIPLTHMSHFFMKYFLWHDIRWGDEPNVNHPETDKKIVAALGQTVTWSAEHIHADGKKNWVEVASYNPMRPNGNEAE